jgi:hypothetical protein
MPQNKPSTISEVFQNIFLLLADILPGLVGCKGKDVSLSCPNDNLDLSGHTLIFTEEPLTYKLQQDKCWHTESVQRLNGSNPLFG